MKGPQTGGTLGEHMDKDDLEKLSDEQVVQLHELYQETQKALVD